MDCTTINFYWFKYFNRVLKCKDIIMPHILDIIWIDWRASKPLKLVIAGSLFDLMNPEVTKTTMSFGTWKWPTSLLLLLYRRSDPTCRVCGTAFIAKFNRYRRFQKITSKGRISLSPMTHPLYASELSFAPKTLK